MDPSFAESLRRTCLGQNASFDLGSIMDTSPTSFDNTYYKLILQGRGLLTSDQTLLTSPVTKDLVTEFADSLEAFYNAFVESMIKMSSITGGEEVRRNCRAVN